jgi:hypothetical protein
VHQPEDRQAGAQVLEAQRAMSWWVTEQEALDAFDDYAAEYPLEALREFAIYLDDYRLDACATAEPAAALIHAFDLLTPHRRAACGEAACLANLQRFMPDRLVLERRRAIALARGEGEAAA